MSDLPRLNDATLVLGFDGWMDGGEVSTGTIDYLVEATGAVSLSEVDPAPFYLYNFPGSREMAALFRPHVRMEDGLVAEYSEPENTLYVSEEANLVLFRGTEPNLEWHEYGTTLMEAARDMGVRRIIFVGSVAGAVPHTRQPRMGGSVSDDALRPILSRLGLRPSNYEGPASLVTYLLLLSKDFEIEMVNIVSEIPAYVQGRNIQAIEAAVSTVASCLGLDLDTRELQKSSRDFVARLDAVVRSRPDLAELVTQIERDYDRETLSANEDELKAWFSKQDIRLD
jgi:proteasome assembly chaperone (PAC2) family protein